MKKIAIALGLAFVVAVGFLAQSVGRASSLERERNDLAARVSALQSERNDLKERLRVSAPTRISEDFMVAAGSIKTYQFTPSVAGTLVGSWRSSGSGTGGMNHSINQFRLTDPRDAMLESSDYGASSGRFVVKVSTRGAYTFFFDNTGLLRTTHRRVFLEGEFRPD